MNTVTAPTKANAKLVGIIYSPGYGAGWSTWGKDAQALDQELAKAIDENRDLKEITEIAKRNWPAAYLGGLHDCKVVWVEEGSLYRIDEYDGSEALILENDFHCAIIPEKRIQP